MHLVGSVRIPDYELAILRGRHQLPVVRGGAKKQVLNMDAAPTLLHTDTHTTPHVTQLEIPFMPRLRGATRTNVLPKHKYPHCTKEGQLVSDTEECGD